MTPDKKLEICKNTREIAANTLYTVLSTVLKSNKKISEAKFRDLWLKELQKHPAILSSGWYDPPPHGLIVLFGTDANPARLDFTSVRSQEWWPRDDVFLDKKSGVLFLYASPVDKQTGIIGDFELTLYLGSKTDIQNHLNQNLTIIQQIVSFIDVGKSFADITVFANISLEKNGLTNNIISTSDPTAVNIGHSIPFSCEEPTQDEIRVLREANTKTVANMISNKRVFVNNAEQFMVRPGMAFTIEPRSKVKRKPHICLAGYHTIVLIKENGEKELLTNFDKLFQLTKMDYMIG